MTSDTWYAAHLSARARLLAGAGAGQAVALAAALVVVRAVGQERAGLAPAWRRGWLAAGGGLAALLVSTTAIRGTLIRRPRSRRWIARELEAVDDLNPNGGLEIALYVPVALQAAVLEELLFRGLPSHSKPGFSRRADSRDVLSALTEIGIREALAPAPKHGIERRLGSVSRLPSGAVLRP